MIGVDVGGSKTHGVRWVDGRVAAEAFGRSANISSVGVAEAKAQLTALLDELTGDRETPVRAVCVGTAGGDAAEQVIRGVLRQRFGDVPVRVVNDTQLILAAAGLESGVVVISGTGSAAWGRDGSGAQARAGGWGYLLGDDGGAYGVVRAALREVLGRADDGLPPDALTSAFLRGTSTSTPRELIDLFYREPSRRRWASESTLVFDLAEAGDAVARSVVEAAAGELVRAAERVCRSLRTTGPVVLAGGLAVHQPLLVAAVRSGLAARGIGDLRVLAVAPVLGAVALAEGTPAEQGTLLR